ncbi:MAG: hypothetical protein HOV80_04045 [Polyangiaceae bacterium]|nr:hypothetical protein [Polyangiaceae bacterium]
MNGAASTTFITLALVLSFASLATVHVAIVYTLAARREGLRAMAAGLLPPATVWLALRGGMPIRAVLWALLAIAYAVLLALAW